MMQFPVAWPEMGKATQGPHEQGARAVNTQGGGCYDPFSLITRTTSFHMKQKEGAQMKRTFITLLAAILLLAGSAWAQTDTLTILHVNDSHSHLVPYGPKDEFGVGTRGGIARAASIIGQVQATEDNVLFLHAGDIFIGDFMFNKYFGVGELQILAQLGCDAMTLGNHEFDLTPFVLKLALGTAGFPIPGFDVLCANLDATADPDLDALVQPYVIRDVGDLKVGIFGLTTEVTNAFSMPAPCVLTSFIDGAVASVSALQAECDVIIALTHLGYDLDCILAANVPGIDIIVGGHSHDGLVTPTAVVNPLGDTTWIVQAGEFYGNVGNLKLACDPSGVEILGYQLIPVNGSVPEVPEVAAAVQFLVDGLEADPRYGPVYSDVIAEAAVDIERDRISGYKDTPMGNLVTDAYRDTTKTDIALAVWGFISQKLYAGPLSGADIFQTVSYGYDEISGHGFRMATFELTGMELFMGLEYTTEQAKYLQDLYIQVSGISFGYDSSQPLGSKLIWVLVGDQPIDPFAIYTITTNSGLAGFLSMAGLEPTNLQDAGLTEYEAVRDYIIKNSPINYGVEGRIRDVHEALVTAPLQIIHNAADPSADVVDIYVNRVLFQDDFAFRSATPFVEVLAEVNLNIGIAPSNSTAPGDFIADFNVTLEPEERYLAIASGLVDPAGFADNPDGGDIDLLLFARDGIRDGAPADRVRVIAFHGVTDAPAVDILARRTRSKWRLFNNFTYGEFSQYRNLPAGNYILDVTPERDNSTVIASFEADLSALGGGTAVLFASGFLDPSANQDGPAFGLFTALPDGQVLELPAAGGGKALAKSGLSEIHSLPLVFRLDQNYPNPFNPTTTISFALPEATDVTLKVYNSLGQLVTTLVQERMGPGVHQVKFDAANLATGVYFCHIRAGSFTKTRKMMLMK
jgi:5'-nucleotidase/UDP-sugar diphosphatase